MMSITEIVEQVAHLESQGFACGIRFVAGSVAEGDTLAPSYKWVDGEWTTERLAGTSAVEVRANTASVERAMRIVQQYAVGAGGIVLAASDYDAPGEDAYERVLIGDVTAVVVIK